MQVLRQAKAKVANAKGGSTAAAGPPPLVEVLEILDDDGEDLEALERKSLDNAERGIVIEDDPYLLSECEGQNEEPRDEAEPQPDLKPVKTEDDQDRDERIQRIRRLDIAQFWV